MRYQQCKELLKKHVNSKKNDVPIVKENLQSQYLIIYQTCKNTDLLGKSSYVSWEEGEMKLCYFGGVENYNFMNIYTNIFQMNHDVKEDINITHDEI